MLVKLWHNHKSLTIIAIVWAVVMLVAQWRQSASFTTSGSFADYAFYAYTLIPLCAMVLYFSTKILVGKLWDAKIFDVKLLMKVLFIVLPIIFALDIYFAGKDGTGWGTFQSGGWMLVIALLIAAVNEDKLNKAQALSYGIMGAFFFMYVWEIAYQLGIYYKSGQTITYEWAILFPSFLMATPFAIVTIALKARLTKWAFYCLGVVALMVLIWVATGFKTYTYFEGGTWLTMPSLNHAIYTITRISKVAFGLSMLGFRPK